MAEYIKREAATNAVIDFYWKGMPFSSSGLAKAINNVPAADVAPVRHGKWVFGGDGCVICSECNEEEPNNNHRNYCPNCGAKMDGGADHKV